MITLPKKVILASSSPRRRDILEQMGIAFDIMPSLVEENAQGYNEPAEMVCNLASLKANDVVGSLSEDCLVIGADTIVFKNGVLGKPKDKQDAMQMLQYIQGGWHEVFTGIALIDRMTGYRKIRYECTRVEMMPLDGEQIKAYVDSGEYVDKAGGYAVQGMAAAFITRIDGCYFNVVGLPASTLYKELLCYKQTIALSD